MFKVSVLMCVYNGSRFLSEAIESILSQTFEDFEFIIIDDGSTDESYERALSYDDDRIKLVRNNTNIGLTRSLNRGIELARGEYVARMDCDDVSLPERLERQVDFLDRDISYSAVAAVTIPIGVDGGPGVDWPADYETTTWEDIRKRLPKENCIAHSSVMIRAGILKEYGYNEKIREGQDYELWLRLCSDGRKIGKIDKGLLELRRHAESVSDRYGPYRMLINSSRYKAAFFFSRLARMKVKRWDFMVLTYAFADLYKCVWKGLKKLKESLASHFLVCEKSSDKGPGD